MIHYSPPLGLKEYYFPDGGTWYTHNGHYLTSVGKILNTVYPMPRIDPFYLTRGKMVHDACCLIDAGILDWDNLDSRLTPFCLAYQNFLEMVHPVVEASELIVVASDYSHGCRLDRVFRLPSRDRLLVTEIKLGGGKIERYWLQTAAQALLLGGENVGDFDLAILNLLPPGKPRLTVAYDPGSKVAAWRKILANYLKLQEAAL